MWRNPIFITGLGAAAVVAAIVANLVLAPDEDRPTKSPPPAPVWDKAVPEAAKPAPPKPHGAKPGETGAVILPSFDVVRVSPEGDTVIAGRAAPGATVIIKDGTMEIGRVTADDKGEWVFVPSGPLPPGNRQLSLESPMPDGSVRVSEDMVVLSVPEYAQTPPVIAEERKTEPLAIQVPRLGDGPSKVIQGGTPGKVTFDISAVDYTPDGRTIVSGRAPAGALVRLYVDGKAVGEAAAGADGRWSVTLKEKLAPGMHQLWADQLAEGGKAVARAAVPFNQDANLMNVPADQRVVVQPGNSLWRIARRVYGEGLQYTVIYRANEKQIADPDLIYPGQVFKVPPKTN